MSTVFPTFYPDEGESSPRRTNWPNWLREPLLHFLVLGALLFATDHFIAGRADDPRTILVDAHVDSEARQVFKNARGHEPSDEELYALRRVWLDNEVLYREGLALQVDRGDPAIRDRVIFKALSVVDAGLKLPPVEGKVLREWFERNRAKYDEPARYDFEEAVLAGDTPEAAMRDFATALNTGAPSEGKAGLRMFKGRPLANLVQSYGPEFVKTLDASPVGEWRALPGRNGWHVMRLQSIAQPKPAVFENLSGIVLQDWTDATMADQRTAAVRALAKKYTVKVEAATK
jgi:hypothetical protein